MSKKKLKGFTLVELLVVIAIIALLVAIVFPAISNALLRGRVTATSVNGRNIHQAVVGESVASVYFSDTSPWPDSDVDSTTTDYFRRLVTNKVLNVSWAFFAPPGIPAAQNEQSFAAQNHGWRVVEGAEILPDTAPFIFTKNLELSSLSSAPTVGDSFPSLNQPFRNQGFAFVTRGGAAYALVGDDLRNQERFDQLFVLTAAGGSGNLDNTVLNP